LRHARFALSRTLLQSQGVVAVEAEAVAFTAGAVEAVVFTAGAVGLLGFTVGAGVVAGMAVVDLLTAGAVGFMDLLPTAAQPTLVMG
jgi:hypothetical protein